MLRGASEIFFDNRISSDVDFSRFRLGTLLQSRAQYALALSHVQQARTIHPMQTVVDTKFAELIFQTPSPNRAAQQQKSLQLLDNLIATRRDAKAALFQRAALHAEMKAYPQAERDLRGLLKLHPEERGALALLARVAAQSKKQSVAMECLVKLQAAATTAAAQQELFRQIQMLALC